MKTMTEGLFVYGTLKLPDVQREIIGREVELLADTLKGYTAEPVVIDGTEYRTLVPHEDAEIGGAIISVTKDELERIDDYEPDEYKRTCITATSGKTAWFYIKS